MRCPRLASSPYPYVALLLKALAPWAVSLSSVCANVAARSAILCCATRQREWKLLEGFLEKAFHALASRGGPPEFRDHDGNRSVYPHYPRNTLPLLLIKENSHRAEELFTCVDRAAIEVVRAPGS